MHVHSYEKMNVVNELVNLRNGLKQSVVALLKLHMGLLSSMWSLIWALWSMPSPRHELEKAKHLSHMNSPPMY